MLRTAAIVLLLAAHAPCGPARAAEETAPGAVAEDDEEEDEEQDLRERLTEREDKRRPEQPRSIQLGGRPLVISGEFETESFFVRRAVLADPDVRQRDRLFNETGIEVEAFYSFGEQLSVFGQVRPTVQRDLLDHVEDEVSDLYLELGEIWLNSEDVLGSALDLDLGRIDFEDERRWWWDDELEGARVSYEVDDLELSLAFARRLVSERTDLGYVEPEEDRVARWIFHAQWDLADAHALEFFGVHHDDRSSTERVGETVRSEREDESDGRFRWLGARAMGAFDLRPRAILGYWLDLAWLRGDERRLSYDEDDAIRRSTVESEDRNQVRGLAYDAGVSLELASLPWEPRVFAGRARADRDFRQVGLEGNEAGFGGVERFPSYGILLDPDLSNLGIWTAGAGMRVLGRSSLDLVYHAYRLVDRSARLPGIALEVDDEVLQPCAVPAPDAQRCHADLGWAVDLVLALEEWERLEFAFALSAFRSGRAFARDFEGRKNDPRNETSLSAYFAFRWAF
jgi:hypothetical protein